MVRLRSAALALAWALAAACSTPPQPEQPAAPPAGASTAALAPAEPAAPQAPPQAVPKAKPVTPLMPRNIGFQQAGELFASRGVQRGQPLPQLSLLDLDGKAVASPCAGKPLVLVTCSLTCNVARNRQSAIAQLRQKWGERADVVLVYTIDAHPAVDDCPYTGSNWVTPGNDADGVLVRQPTSLEQRLALARRYAVDWAGGARVLVDGMDDASWHALGEAPNLGLVIGKDGVVVERCGWFDLDKVGAALDRLPR